MKAGDAQLGTYIEYDVEHNKKDPKFKVGKHVKIWKNKSIFSKGDTQNRSEKVQVMTKVKHIGPFYMFFYEKRAAKNKPKII